MSATYHIVSKSDNHYISRYILDYGLGHFKFVFKNYMH